MVSIPEDVDCRKGAKHTAAVQSSLAIGWLSATNEAKSNLRAIRDPEIKSIDDLIDFGASGYVRQEV